MVHQWFRFSSMEQAGQQFEVWQYKNKITKEEKKYRVNVRAGKKLNIVALKIPELSKFKTKIAQVKSSRQKIFQSSSLRQAALCPICRKPKIKNQPAVFQVYQAEYLQCPFCSHCYASSIPAQESLERFYAQNKDYQQIYISKQTAQLRVNQVALPKAQWVVEQFEKIYGQKPASLLDIGAGGGHFVQACRQLGLKADGLEISSEGQQFCREYFGFNLLAKNFLKDLPSLNDYQIITFWGLLEHTAEPLQMLERARQITAGKKGLVVAAVPRWNSFSTAVQKNFSQSIIRHLEPLSHLHCFTDSSLATAYLKSKLEIKAAWYFGMDAYELASQLANQLNDRKIIEALQPKINSLQEALDKGLLSDEITLAGRALA